MVLIEGGTFVLGWAKDPCWNIPKTAYCWRDDARLDNVERKVRVDTFWIDRTEVTLARYAVCVAEGVCAEPAASNYTYIEDGSFCGWVRGRANEVAFPVKCATYGQAECFCQWAGKRLPTEEEEWEYAARGSENRFFPWGDNWPPEPSWNKLRGDLGWYEGPSRSVGTSQVDVTPAGVEDMAANAFEWVAPQIENRNDTKRIVKGGSDVQWSSGDLRASHRMRREMHEGAGFRCARSAN